MRSSGRDRRATCPANLATCFDHMRSRACALRGIGSMSYPVREGDGASPSRTAIEEQPCRPPISQPACVRAAAARGVQPCAGDRSSASPGRRSVDGSNDGSGRGRAAGVPLALCTSGRLAQLAMATTLATRASRAGRTAAALYGLVAPPPDPEVLDVERTPRRDVCSPRCARPTRCRRATSRPSTGSRRRRPPAPDRPRRPPAPRPLRGRARHRDRPTTRHGRTTRRHGPDALGATAERVRGRPGAPRAAASGACTCREPLGGEGAARRRELGLPDPRVNYRVQVGGRRRYLDLAWPDAKVAVEFDGFVPHSTRRVFDDDRARQNDLVADGWTVFRVTKTMLDADPVGDVRADRRRRRRAIAPHAVTDTRVERAGGAGDGSA